MKPVRIEVCPKPGHCPGLYLAYHIPKDHPLYGKAMPCACARQAEAARLAAQRPAPTHAPRLQQARLALDEGRVKQALLMLQGELSLTPRDHELHHWMAVAAARMGDTARARRHLELAVEYSNLNASPEQHAIYAGKLQRLKEQLQMH